MCFCYRWITLHANYTPLEWVRGRRNAANGASPFTQTVNPGKRRSNPLRWHAVFPPACARKSFGAARPLFWIPQVRPGKKSGVPSHKHFVITCPG